MKIPLKLKVGGHMISVDSSKELEGLNGEALLSKNIINICKTLPQSQKESTLFHEIFHFLNTTVSGTPLGHSLIDSLSEQFYQVLSDNNLLK